MAEFRDGYAYKSPYIVGLVRPTRSIPSGNHASSSVLWQRETRTSVGHSYAEIVRSQKDALQTNELGSEECLPARGFRPVQWYGCEVLSMVH